MSLKIAIQIDPIHTLNPKGDSTIALMEEANRRNHKMFLYDVDDLSMKDGEVHATGTNVTINKNSKNQFRLSQPKKVELNKFDVVLMRQDPPFNMKYITATHILEQVNQKTVVVNNPKEVRNAPEKIFVTKFSEFMPPTLITRNRNDIHKFRNEHGDIIIKPLYGNGGAGVFQVNQNDQNINALIEMFEMSWEEPFVIQKYLKDVRKGDKRIILINGKPEGAINRVPMKNETRSNLHVGGKATKTNITKHEQKICEVIGPELKKRGLMFVGIDVIGGCITEINVTSPTGIQEIKKLSGKDITKVFWDNVENIL